jgi:hypothetical protein
MFVISSHGLVADLYTCKIDVKEESWDRSMEGGYERDILSSEYYLGFRMHTPIICKETLHIDFQIKINNCSNAHESHSAFEEYHKDVVVPLDYGHDLQLTMIVAALGDVASSISHHWLQSEELCHYPIDQALSKGVQSDHIGLSFSPTKAQIHYTAYWDDSNSAKTYCHEHLIKDDGDLVMVQCDKFHCSLLWWEQAITSAEKYIPTKKIRDEESLRTPISKEQNNKSI